MISLIATKPLPKVGEQRRLSVLEMQRIRKLGFTCSTTNLVYSDGSISTGAGKMHPGVKLQAQSQPKN